MPLTGPLATVPVSCFDWATGLSALAVQHIRCDKRTALVYHDAPTLPAAVALLFRVSAALSAELSPGQSLTVIECSMPEHPVEPFIYARVGGEVMALDAVAEASGVPAYEIERTQTLVAAIHRPRACAFPGFRQLPLGARVLRADFAA